MILLPIMLGAVLVALFFLNSFRQPSLSPRMLLLAALLCIIGALLVENLETARFDREEALIVGIGAVLFVAGIALAVFEGRRASEEAPNKRNGVLSIGAGIGLLILAIVVPAGSASLELPGQLAQLPTPTPGPTQSTNQRARGIFDRVVDLVAVETGLTYDEIVANFDEGISVADMVRETDGDLDAVIAGISELLIEQVQFLASEGTLTEVQAGLAVSQMEVIVRVGVEQDLAAQLERFEDNPAEETPEAE